MRNARYTVANWLAPWCVIWAANVASAAVPTAREQEMLEMVNRFRAHPREELDVLANLTSGPSATWLSPRSDDANVDLALSFFNTNSSVLRSQFDALLPVPPLAWNTNLQVSASNHNHLMIANDLQSHNLPGEPDLINRMTNAGYQFAGGGFAGENIFAFSESVFYGHAGFVIDWGGGPTGIQNPPGHRENLLDSSFREIGISIVDETSAATDVGPLVMTQHLARANSRGPFLTGVAFRDVLTANDFYTPGEGLGCVTINVFQANTSNLVTSTATWDSGGYALALASGTYDVVATDPRLGGAITVRQVVVTSNNVKLDFEPASTAQIGDANGDGSVGAADYALWAAQFGQTGNCSTADFDSSSSVGAGDYALWAANFGHGGNGAVVPEPATAGLACVGLVAAGALALMRRW